MPIVVEVKSAEDYAKWADAHKSKTADAVEDVNKVWDLKDLVTRGEKVYTANCLACHQANGKGVPPAFPALDGSPVATGPKAAHIATVSNGVLRDGKPTAMVGFKNALSPTDLAAVITYERNRWGNKTGQAVQPAEVAGGKS